VLRRIQGIRFGRRTTVVVIVVAIVIWAVFVLASLEDFVPAELRERPTGPTADSVRTP